MSILIPLIALLLQSTVVFRREGREYQVALNEPLNPGLWIVYGCEALITYLILWPFTTRSFLCRTLVVLFCIAIWVSFMFLTEPDVKKIL
jgi:hypothetical protein